MPASPSPIANLQAIFELPEQLQIEHFLNGRTDGRALLEALYGATPYPSSQPVPPEMKR